MAQAKEVCSEKMAVSEGTGGLPHAAKEAQIKEHLGQVGEIEMVTLKTDTATGRSKGIHISSKVFGYYCPNVKSPVFQRIFLLEEKFEMFQDALEISHHLSYLSQ
mgnify:CR=1 FL=1